jgi:hypothetical protein
MPMLNDAQTLMVLLAELSAFFSSTTLPAGTPTSSPSVSSSLTIAPSDKSSSAVNQVPSAVTIGGVIVGVLFLLLLILAVWLYYRRIQLRNRKAKLPMQSPSLSSLIGSGNEHLTPVPSISSSVTWIATDPASPFFRGQPESMTSPASPAAQSSMIIPYESRRESRVSTASTVVPSAGFHA